MQTPRGLAYAQYSHRSPNFGPLIRILPGFYDVRPDSFEELARSKERFYVFFPVGAAVKQELVQIVAKEEVPAAARKFPLMRMEGLRNQGGEVEHWRLYDGERSRAVGRLSPEQQTLSVVELWSYPVLVERITEDWSPATAYLVKTKTAGKRSFTGYQPNLGRSAKSIDSPRAPRVRTDYLYFPAKASAEEASRILKAEGYEVKTRKSADAINWLVLVKSSHDASTSSVADTRDRLESLASSLGGEFDGGETSL